MYKAFSVNYYVWYSKHRLHYTGSMLIGTMNALSGEVCCHLPYWPHKSLSVVLYILLFARYLGLRLFYLRNFYPKGNKWTWYYMEDGWRRFAFLHYNYARRMTQICVFNTRLFSLHNTLNYAIRRACLRMVLLTDIYRNLTSLWINL